METKNRLYKSQNDKALFGVCGGLAEYFKVDSLVVRLLFVLFTLVYGAGLLFYLIAALVIPSEPVSGTLQTAGSAAPVAGEGGSPSYVATDGTQYENRASGNMPREEEPDSPPEIQSAPPFAGNPVPAPVKDKNRDSGKVLGLALVAMGGLILVKVFFPWVDSRAMVGIGMVLAGLFFIVKKA